MKVVRASKMLVASEASCLQCRTRLRLGDWILRDSLEGGPAGGPYGRRSRYWHARCIERLLDKRGPDSDSLEGEITRVEAMAAMRTDLVSMLGELDG